jgi:ketosteroid isomerase-like protein
VAARLSRRRLAWPRRPRDAVSVVTELWARIAARDWQGFGRLLADDVVLELPVSGELVRGRDHVVAVNAEYPDGWSIEVLRVVGAGDQAVSEVQVPMEGVGVFRAASFWTVRDGLVVHGREYWTGLGADEAPAWRAPYTERL